MKILGRLSILFLPVLLSACMFGGGDEPPRRPTAQRPIQPRPSGPVVVADPQPRETQQCLTELRRDNIEYNVLADRDFGGGCIVTGAVQLLDIGVPVTNLKSMRCPLARTFTAWIRNGVAPAARQILGSELVRVESYGTYACRGIVGRGAQGAARVSEHGLGNAVDISAFILADGRRITIERDWRSGDSDVREFMEAIHRSACRRFQTVLSPDYNAAHYNHLHLDMGRGPFCR